MKLFILLMFTATINCAELGDIIGTYDLDKDKTIALYNDEIKNLPAESKKIQVLTGLIAAIEAQKTKSVENTVEITENSLAMQETDKPERKLDFEMANPTPTGMEIQCKKTGGAAGFDVTINLTQTPNNGLIMSLSINGRKMATVLKKRTPK